MTPEPEDECELCGDDHDTRDCDLTVCGACNELLDNCDCEQPEEMAAEEWYYQYYRLS